MPQKKKHELIIQNVCSISSVVRKQSFIQLYDLPESLVSKADKITLYEKALQDEEESIRGMASAYLIKLGVVPKDKKVKEAPEKKGQSEENKIVENPAETEVIENPPVPEVVENVSEARTEEESRLPLLSEKIEKQGKSPMATSAESFDQEYVVEAPFLEDPVDSSLIDPKSLKAIPQKLDYVAKLSRERPSGTLTYLIIFSQDTHEEVALTALQTVLNLKDPRAPGQFLSFLLLPGFSSQRRFLILKIIMETRAELDVKALEHVLRSEKDVIVKSGLVKVFARLSGEEGVETLKWCLRDSDARVRANTVEVLEEMKIVACSDEVAQLLTDSENRVKVNAAKFLVKIGHPEAFPTLKKMLGSSEVWLRDSVIFALGEIGDTASLTLLKAALKDPNQGIRLSVLKALAKINTETARQTIQGTCQDQDQVVAQVARGLWEKIKNSPPKQIISAPLLLDKKWDSLREKQVSSLITPQVQPTKPIKPLQTVLPTKPQEDEPSELPSEEPVSEIPQTQPSPPQLSRAKPSQPTPSSPKISQGQQSTVHPPLPKISRGQPLQTQTAQTAPKTEHSDADPFSRKVDDLRVQLSSINLIDSDSAETKQEPSATPKPPLVPALDLVSRTTTGGPVFQKPRSSEVYSKLNSDNPAERQRAAQDMALIFGDDQITLLTFASQSTDETLRLAAAKLLSRKRGPKIAELLRNLADDSNQLVSSMAQKALTMIK
ncbi:MAG: HEAT repeat domain-containing protein [Candidatus Riflebacteria bacterium]|nr:HEAT repeat domain-containing protein [Candidatus Riflebacteria bacterium]